MQTNGLCTYHKTNTKNTGVFIFKTNKVLKIKNQSNHSNTHNKFMQNEIKAIYFINC